VARTLEVVGERWTLLIVRDALLGVSRFDQFRDRLPVSASVLAARLRKLVRVGVLKRQPYHTRPARYEYRLAARGWDLAPVVLALMEWGDRYLAGESGPPRAARHRACGGRVETRLVCLSCARHVGPADVVVQA
jgi:DNA-binding HxlR family transcriptional regulator